MPIAIVGESARKRRSAYQNQKKTETQSFRAGRPPQAGTIQRSEYGAEDFWKNCLPGE
jgi:hypothetical protein